jgi:hypothetical protein
LIFFKHPNILFMKSKALITFSRLKDADILTKSRSIINCLTNNSYFLSPTPSLADMTSVTEEYATRLVAAQGGSRADIAEKNAQREALTSMLQQLSDYVNLIAAGDRTMLTSSGFDLNKQPQPITIGQPEDLRVLNGINEGELVVSVSAVKGAKAYVYEYTMDASLAAGSWISITGSKRKIVVAGLQPGKRYYCRVAAVGANGQIAYTAVISRIVI